MSPWTADWQQSESLYWPPQRTFPVGRLDYLDYRGLKEGSPQDLLPWWREDINPTHLKKPNKGVVDSSENYPQYAMLANGLPAYNNFVQNNDKALIIKIKPAEPGSSTCSRLIMSKLSDSVYTPWMHGSIQRCLAILCLQSSSSTCTLRSFTSPRRSRKIPQNQCLNKTNCELNSYTPG